MSLKFYPLLEKEYKDELIQQKTRAQTIIISLIDLKPQQLPITERQFIFSESIHNSTLKYKENISPQEKEEEIIYSNIQSMLWISGPVKLGNTRMINDHIPAQMPINFSDLRNLNCSQLQIRYLYLPPVSQLMKQYSNRVKKQQSLSAHTLVNNQLPHFTQLVIQQRHQLMYCLSRELSSCVVYEFGSKYIRFDHLAWRDYRNSVFGEDIQRKNMKNTRLLQEQQQDIPYYVVIKSSSYSSERDYEVYKVKLTNSSQQSLLSSRSQSSSSYSQSSSMGSMSMEIESKSILPIKKKVLKEGQNQFIDKEKMIKELEEISDKLLHLKEKAINISDLAKHQNEDEEKTLAQTSTIETSVNETQKLSQSTELQSKTQSPFSSQLLVRKSQLPHIRSLDFAFLYNLLRNCVLNHLNTNQQLTLTKSIIDNDLCYYTTCTQIKDKLTGYYSFQESQHQNKQLEITRSPIYLLELFNSIFIQNHINSSQNDKFSSTYSQESTNHQIVTFQKMEKLQNFIVQYLVSKFGLEQLISLNTKLPQTQQQFKLFHFLSMIKYQQTELHLSPSEVNLIKCLNSKIHSYLQKNMIILMQNETHSFIERNLKTSQLNLSQSVSSQSSITDTHLPILDISIPTQLKQNHSQQIYSHLKNKLQSFNLPHQDYLPFIFSHPFQSQYLKTTITQKDNQIRKLHQQIAQLQVQLNQKQSIIEDQEHKITKYKLDEVFYQQIMNELNSTQSCLDSETQCKKKLTIDLQCTKILNIQANQTIEHYKLKQARLLQEKQNFLEAISHLSKQNQHYITLSQQLSTTIESLNHKIEKYKLIDIEINNLKRKNHQLSEVSSSIKTWKQTVENQHKELLKVQVSKFNFVLKLNHQKYHEKTLMISKMKEFILELTDQVQNKAKQCALLEDEINYLKKRYFNSTHLNIDYGVQDNQQHHYLSKFPPRSPNHHCLPLQTR